MAYEAIAAQYLRDAYGLLGTVEVAATKQIEINNLLSSATFSTCRDSNIENDFLAIANGDIENKNEFDTTQPLPNNEILDEQYKQEFVEKVKYCKEYIEFSKIRQKLPCFEKMDEICDTIWANQVTLISGETGCGKTTQIPQYILNRCLMEGNGSVTKIICTQPRRISAISVGQRVADERIEQVGENTVGYHIRLEKALPRNNGSITFCTTGILLKQMVSDPYLTSVSHIILDEIHERNTFCDFLMTLLKELLTRRKDLKLILMSATFNSEEFAKYFEYKCGQVKIPGFTFPVMEYYLEDVILLTKHKFSNTRNMRFKTEEFNSFIKSHISDITKSYPSYVSSELLKPASEELDVNLIQKLIIEICHGGPGAILVFLPGLADINKLYLLLTQSGKFPNYKYKIFPLHSRMPSAEQLEIFDEPPDGVRKIIISTNIAETSITINDVVYVIDWGKIKVKNYDVTRNLDSLRSEWVSLANANQRRGRAGRVKSGICYHLFTRARKMTFEPQQKPEIQRERLESIILQIKILKLGNAQLFLNKIMDSPSSQSVEKSLSALRYINALDANEKLTPLGYHLANIPMSPQLGKMLILGALFSCLDPILSVAASLDFRDAFQRPAGKEDKANRAKITLSQSSYSDHLLFHEALSQYVKAKDEEQEQEFCSEYFLSSDTLNLLYDMKKDLATYLYDMKFISDNDFSNYTWNVNSENKSLVKAIITGALYPNVAIARKYSFECKEVVTIDNEKVNIARSSVNESRFTLPTPLLVYYLKLESGTKTWLHDTTVVYPLSLLFFAENIVVVDEPKLIRLISKVKVSFKCSPELADLIVNIRQKFNDFLEYKVSDPSVVDWTQENEVNILRAIIQLVTENAD